MNTVYIEGLELSHPTIDLSSVQDLAVTNVEVPTSEHLQSDQEIDTTAIWGTIALSGACLLVLAAAASSRPRR